MKKVLWYLSAVAFAVTTIFVAVFGVILFIDIPNLESPITVILPIIALLVLNVGLFLLCVSAKQNLKGYNAKYSLPIGVGVVVLGLLLLLVARAVNFQIA